ncbi:MULTISPECIES: response regulator transcription factor [Clostridium]|uniref:response regulator transcription factor n=1 Tax=Clostridium TaxID=1485 RepID=UPI000826A4C4|nr:MULTISPECIES: response regulator transcription factor [Clostridium]PJI08963.1 DNA-binding response regulator [Clostridium sp. CT7]
MDNIKILIADDQTLMRDGLKTILELEENFEIVGTVQNGEEVLKFCKENRPDLVLMDIRMPKMDGVKCTKILKSLYKDIKILILTTFNDTEYIIEALNYGAEGYILKDIEGDELIKAVNDAYKGSLMLPSKVAKKLAQSISKSTVIVGTEAKKVLKNFSNREEEIAKMIVGGFNNKQIASSLFISEGTVKNYISNIYGKIETSNRLEAAKILKSMFEDKFSQ